LVSGRRVPGFRVFERGLQHIEVGCGGDVETQCVGLVDLDLLGAYRAPRAKLRRIRAPLPPTRARRRSKSSRSGRLRDCSSRPASRTRGCRPASAWPSSRAPPPDTNQAVTLGRLEVLELGPLTSDAARCEVTENPLNVLSDLGGNDDDAWPGVEPRQELLVRRKYGFRVLDFVARGGGEPL
jgi:hypothetical protein